MLIFQLKTSDEYRRTLEDAEQVNNDDLITAANIRELRHEYDRATKLAQVLVEKASDVSSVFYSVSTGLADIAQSAVRKSSPIPVDILYWSLPH